MTDTTMGGGRGGVGIRLFLTGGEVVKRTFNQVADSGRKMWAEIALGEKAANPALRAVSRVSGEVQGSMASLGTRAGMAGTALSAFGAYGVAAAAALGGLVLALGEARKAMDWADALEDSAAKINIGVEALQEWRFAAMEAGGAATDADSAIDGFQKKLGEGMAGGRSVKWFERLGFGREDLKAFRSTEEALDAVIDRIAALGTEAERAAVAEKLGLGPLIPLIRQGTDAIEDMRLRAQELGVVMDQEMVKRGAEAAREMEVLQHVLDMKLKQAFIDMAPVLIDTMELVVKLADGLKALAESWKDFKDRSNEGLQNHDQMLARQQGRLIDVYGQPSDMPATVRGRFDRINAERVRIARIREERASERAAVEQSRPGATSLIDVTGTRRGRNGPTEEERAAERRRQEAQREVERLTQMDVAAQRSFLEHVTGSVETAESRANVQTLLLNLEEGEQRAAMAKTRAAIEAGGLMTDENRQRLENIEGLQAEAMAARRRRILEEERRAVLARRLAEEEARDEHAIDMLDLDEQMARSTRERLEIARRILILQQELELKLLEQTANEDEVVTSAEQGDIDRLRERQRREVEVFDHNAREDMRAEFKSWGHEVADAIKEKRVGQWIAEEMQARLLDMFLDGLFDFLHPQGGQAAGGGGSGWIGQIVGAVIGGTPMGGGRAGGGSLSRGLRHPVLETGRPELLMLGGRGHVTGAEDTARLLREMAGSGANGGRTVVEQHLHFDNRGAVMTEDLLGQMQSMANSARNDAVRDATNISRRAAPGLQRRMQTLGTT